MLGGPNKVVIMNDEQQLKLNMPILHIGLTF